MANYGAVIHWHRADQAFADNKYSRGHTWTFDGGEVVPASASPHIVPLPMSVAENVDPEEAFVASLSSCHMLFYLTIAQREGFVVDEYLDAATGRMGKTSDNKYAMTSVKLYPQTKYHGAAPDSDKQAAMHHEAHESCFIANSVTTKVETVLE